MLSGKTHVCSRHLQLTPLCLALEHLRMSMRELTITWAVNAEFTQFVSKADNALLEIVKLASTAV